MHAKYTVIITGLLDNKSLLCTGLLELKKVQEKQDKEVPFAYSSDFYEDGISWHEDVWSKRSYHSIHDNMVDENKLHIEFSGKVVMILWKTKMQGCTDFMELTITKKELYNQSVILETNDILSTSDTTSTSSKSTL